MNVSAAEKSTGKEQRITITNDKGRMSADEIERLVQEAERYKAQDEANRARIEAKNALENYTFSLRNTINDEKLAGKISDSDKNKVLDAIQSTIKWLESHQSAEKEEFEEKQKALEAIINPILSSLSGGSSAYGGMGKNGFASGSVPTDHDEGPKIEEID